MVVSGAPEQEESHADKVCHMALDMVDVIGGLTDPSTGESLRIRVGMSSVHNIFLTLTQLFLRFFFQLKIIFRLYFCKPILYPNLSFYHIL